MCDAPLGDGNGRKRVVAFVGGLDITNGRYDDPTFPLWSTIPTVHSRYVQNKREILSVTGRPKYCLDGGDQKLAS